MKKTLPLLLLLLAGSLLLSCMGEPDTPADERKNKDHGDPTRMMISLRHGTLSHGIFTPTIRGLYAQPELSEQIITFALDSVHGWAPTANSAEQFSVLVGDSSQHAYEMRMNYFDIAGNDITYQFVSNGQEMIHQHFFIPGDVKTLSGEATKGEAKTAKLYDYTYLDTSPWDSEIGAPNVKIIGRTNPIGMKGAFIFKLPRTFNMTIRLMHARESKFNSKGEISPYYKPTNGQILSDSWDIQMRVPFIAKE